MLIVNGKDDLIEVPNSKTEITWKCGHCGKVRTEPSRNLRRRIWFCQCVKKQEQIKDFERRLNEKGFTFRHDLTDEYKLNHNGMIDQSKTTIPIECLRCGSRFNSRLSNVLSGRKKCDCAPNKHHTTDLTAQEYIQKWTKHNQKHFDLLDMEYKGRTSKYKVRCRSCGFVDSRWGITLQGTDIRCKKCELGSVGERKIADWLDSQGIPYEREYKVLIDGAQRRYYDFFLPEQKMMIEFHGQQHYEPIEYFGGQERFKRQQLRDRQKEDFCKTLGYHLLVIKYTDDIEKKLSHSLRFNDQA